MLGTVLAHRIGVKVGDEITLETREGPKQLRVAATATAYIVGGNGDLHGRRDRPAAAERRRRRHVIVNAAPGALADVEAKLKPLCETNGLMLQSFADLRKRVDELTKGVIAGLWGLLVLGLIVGAFAIANTLTMNVLEQTRELALLRVVAMTRWQVRKTILAQAIIIGVIGLATGIVGGIVGAYVMNLSSVPLAGPCPGVRLAPVAAGRLLRRRPGGDHRRGLAPRRTRRPAESADRLAVRVGDWKDGLVSHTLQGGLFPNLTHVSAVCLALFGLDRVSFCRSAFESTGVCRY